MKALQAISALTIPWLFDRTADHHLVLRHSNRQRAADHLNQLARQVIARTSPGNVRFLFIDQADLGGGFKAFAALGDASSDVLGDGIATESDTIRKRLAEMVRLISDIKQSKLRDIHATLDAYNQSVRSGAGASGEAYRFIFIANWPHGFDSESCQLLRQVIENGAPCGVHVLATWESGAKLPYDAEPKEIWGKARIIDLGSGNLASSMVGKHLGATLAPAASSQAIAAAVTAHGQGLAKAKSAAYSFRTMMEGVYRSRQDPYDEIPRPWQGSAADQVVIPIGLAGGERIEAIVIGKGGGSSEHNVLVLGPVGSGKSNLLHVMIQSLADIYSPEEVSLFLIDGKYGAEFSLYVVNRPPHARVISLNSESAFGLSVLREIRAEQDRRGEAFQNAGATNLAMYRKRTGQQLPRLILFLDEFQQLLSEEDRSAASEAQQLLKDIARQGRAFGIHMILATQTLKDVDFPVAVQQQIAVRVVLGRSPDGFYGVLSDDNHGANGLERFHALINEKFGHSSGNTVLQVAEGMDPALAAARIGEYQTNWSRVPSERRQAVPTVRVFKGNEPASLRDSSVFAEMLTSKPASSGSQIDLLVGEPLALSEKHCLPLKRSASSNVLAVSRTVAELAGPIMAMLLSALGQSTRDGLAIDVLHALGNTQDETRLKEQLERLRDRLPDQVQIFADPGAPILESLFESYATLIQAAEALPRDQRPQRLLVILGLQELRALRDDPVALAQVLDRGPSVGMHVLCWSNTYATLRGTLGYETGGFGQGILGRVDPDDLSDLVSDRFRVERNRLLAFDQAGFGDQPLVQFRPFALLQPAELDGLLEHMCPTTGQGGKR